MKLWCELVAKMLARLPQERPSATEVSTALSQFVKPVDAAEILRRRMAGLVQRVRETPVAEVDWEREKQNAQAITESDDASPEVEKEAKRFMAEANARVQLGRALIVNAAARNAITIMAAGIPARSAAKNRLSSMTASL